MLNTNLDGQYAEYVAPVYEDFGGGEDMEIEMIDDRPRLYHLSLYANLILGPRPQLHDYPPQKVNYARQERDTTETQVTHEERHPSYKLSKYNHEHFDGYNRETTQSYISEPTHVNNPHEFPEVIHYFTRY